MSATLSDDEQWKNILNFSNYQVSTSGRIRNTKTNTILNGSLTKKGYLRVSLGRGKGKHKYIHRLVAITWIPNPNKQTHVTVDHINRVRHDNMASNLRWATHREQLLNCDRKLNGGFKRRVDKICPEKNTVIKTYPSIRDAARGIVDSIPYKLGTIITQIRVCCKDARFKFGFLWRYTLDRECPGERWKPIKVHPTFQISTFGRVKGPTGIINDHAHLEKVTDYPCVGIEDRQYKRHILVGDAFIGKTKPSNVYNHKDGDTYNCHIDNLEECSAQQNAQHAYTTGLNSKRTRKVDIMCQLTGKKRSFCSMYSASRSLGQNSVWLSNTTKRHGVIQSDCTILKYENYNIQIQNN
jgi:hypothetical protein